MSRSAGHSAGPSPKARAISRVPSAPGLSRRNSISASGEGRLGGLLRRRLNLSSLGPAGQQRKRRIIAADQRLLLLAPPALDLPFGRVGILDVLECLLEYKADRAPAGGVAIVGAGLMFADAFFQAVPRRPGVI